MSVDDAVALKLLNFEWLSGNNGYEYARFWVNGAIEASADGEVVEERKRIFWSIKPI
ncbi:MAG: hypothetical protein ACN6I5_02280 [Hyphomicrobiales bacterium]